MGIENKSFALPEDADRKPGSPERKLELLLETLEALQGEAHEGIPDEVRAAALEENKKRIEELKKEHPELNN